MSCESTCCYVRGRLFTIASLSFTTVVNSSNVKSFFEIAVARATLMVLTSLSKCPPDKGARGVCLCHVMRRAATKSCISGSCWRSWRNRSVARNEQWLSERRTWGVPWVDASLRRHIRNDVAVSDVTVLRYTARNVADKQTYVDFLLLPILLAYMEVSGVMNTHTLKGGVPLASLNG